MRQLGLIATLLLTACSFDPSGQAPGDPPGDKSDDPGPDDDNTPDPTPEPQDEPKSEPEPEPEPCTERVIENLLENSNFDADTDVWVEDSQYQLITNAGPLDAHTGDYMAWLGGYSFGTDRLYQRVSIPAGTTSIALHASLATDNPWTIIDHATLRVKIRSGELTETLGDVDSDDMDTGWYDYGWATDTDYAGKDVAVVFEVDTDLLAISMLVDTVRLQATVCD